MPSLADLQRAMLADLLEGGDRVAGWLGAGAAPAEIALAVHRNTVFAALANALKLTYPTVEQLVGGAFFDQAAAAYVVAHPPRVALLADYGSRFAPFLAEYGPAAALDYLPDVARFDRAIEQAAGAPSGWSNAVIPLGGGVALDLAQSLRLLSLTYPADLIRDALDAGRDDRLAHLDLTPRSRTLAIWRGERGAMVSPLSATAADVLRALLAGVGAAEAFAPVIDAVGADRAASSLQSEIFAASFARVIAPNSLGDRQ